MKTLGQTNTKSKKQQASANPFAQALAETERRAVGSTPNQPNQPNPLEETLAKTGGSMDGLGGLNDQAALEKQQAEIKKQAKKEQLKRKLHDQLNPVDQKAVFDAREKQVKEEIDKLRQELRFLSQDLAQLNKEVEVTLMTEVSKPGQDGKYYINFFQQLRAFIVLLRQKVKSARTWAKQMRTKKKKKKGPGSIFLRGNEAKAVHDSFHHERSNAYSGG